MVVGTVLTPFYRYAPLLLKAKAPSKFDIRGKDIRVNSGVSEHVGLGRAVEDEGYREVWKGRPLWLIITCNTTGIAISGQSSGPGPHAFPAPSLPRRRPPSRPRSLRTGPAAARSTSITRVATKSATSAP